MANHACGQMGLVTTTSAFDENEMWQWEWFEAVEVALAHGWEPEGTLMLGAGRAWSGAYVPVWHQRVLVTESDACGLARALERAGWPPIVPQGSFALVNTEVSGATCCYCHCYAPGRDDDGPEELWDDWLRDSDA